MKYLEFTQSGCKDQRNRTKNFSKTKTKVRTELKWKALWLKTTKKEKLPRENKFEFKIKIQTMAKKYKKNYLNKDHSEESKVKRNKLHEKKQCENKGLLGWWPGKWYLIYICELLQ